MTGFEEILAEKGRLIYKTRGVSMEPLLRQDRDLVIIEPKKGRLKSMDVAFYKCGARYVLHRVISVRDGYYLIRGDNTYAVEKVGEAAVIGVLTGFSRKGVQHSVNETGYRVYSRAWHIIYPARFVFRKLKRLARRAVKKLVR